MELFVGMLAKPILAQSSRIINIASLAAHYECRYPSLAIRGALKHSLNDEERLCRAYPAPILRLSCNRGYGFASKMGSPV